MPASLTTVDAITKEVYGPKIVDQLENSNTLTRRIEKTSQGTTSEAGGKYVTFPIKVRRNHGIGYRNELEALPTAGQQGWAQVRVSLRYGYGLVGLSGQAIELASENFQAFASAMTEEMDGLKNDIEKDTNRILWGDGRGVLATVDTGAAGVNTVSVGTDFSALKWIEIGSQIDILDSTGVTPKASNRKVTAVNDATGDFTFDGAVATVVIGDIVVRTGSYNKEAKGIQGLVKSTGAIQNLDPATEPKWKSVLDSSGGVISESKMIAMCDRLAQNGGKPTVIFMDQGSRRAYFNLLTTQRRITSTQTFTGGFSGLAFTYDEDIPVVTDVDAPAGTIWFLREPDFKVYRRNPWAWDNKDGSIWARVTGFDSYEARMKQYWEFATQRRNTQGYMTGITAG